VVDFTVLSLMNCIRTSQITITSAIRDLLRACCKHCVSSRAVSTEAKTQPLNAFLIPKRENPVDANTSFPGKRNGARFREINVQLSAILRIYKPGRGPELSTY